MFGFLEGTTTGILPYFIYVKFRIKAILSSHLIQHIVGLVIIYFERVTFLVLLAAAT